LNTRTETNCILPVDDFNQLKEKVLTWVNRFSTFCFLDNHQYENNPNYVECLVAVGTKRYVSATAGQSALLKLQHFIDETNAAKTSKGWLFGHLGYELKIETENLSTAAPEEIGFPDLFFFEPEYLIRFNESELHIQGDNADKIAQEIISHKCNEPAKPQSVSFQSRISRSEYIGIVEKLKQHIQRGDCYEINFCQEFFARSVKINPLVVYQQLSKLSPNPFSALYRLEDKWLLCASPERFLSKKGNRLLSQPIKGTSKRVPNDKILDTQQKEILQQSEKDKSENVMVVDLVRNDLSKVCKDGTVRVDELFGIYTFPQVYQMISTISGELKEQVSFTDIIQATFPMGSMTGAPKKRVMELIEQYEVQSRGIFSGAVGYISPSDDFDFNVVIRSVLYQETSGYLSYRVGSGITFYSDAANEWEECMMKAKAINQVFTQKQ